MLSFKKSYLLSVPLFFFLFSCEKEAEYIDTSYQMIYQASNIYLREGAVLFEYDENPTFDTDSRLFYQSADTSLTFKIARPNRSHPEYGVVCAVDWRISKIQVITLQDYDEDHPAGSSINDLLQIEYRYKDNSFTIPLTEVNYGVIMLCDFFPYRPYHSPLLLQRRDKRKQMPRIEVRIDDAFGRTLTAQSKQSD